MQRPMRECSTQSCSVSVAAPHAICAAHSQADSQKADNPSPPLVQFVSAGRYCSIQRRRHLFGCQTACIRTVCASHDACMHA